MPGAMSGRLGSGPRARAAATSSSNAFACAGGVRARHAASISTTSLFCCSRLSRSALECLANGGTSIVVMGGSAPVAAPVYAALPQRPIDPQLPAGDGRMAMLNLLSAASRDTLSGQ